MPKSNRNHPNALKHGAFAKTAILSGEDPQEFEELHSGLIEEWKPVGPTEEDAVLSIAKGVWRKRRAQRFLDAEIEICRFNPQHPLYDEAHKVRKFLSIMETVQLTEGAPELFEVFFETMARAFLSSSIADYLQKTCPRQNFVSTSAWLRALCNEVNSVILPASAAFGEPSAKVLLGRSARLLTPDAFKDELAVDERIDAMIDRAVKRLVQTKAMKQMLIPPNLRGERSRMAVATTGSSK